MAIRDADVAAAIGIDSIGEGVENCDAVDVYVVGAEHADAVVGGISDRDALDFDMFAAFERDGFRTVTLGSVGIDLALANNGDVIEIFAPNQGMVEERGFTIGGVLEVQCFWRVVVVVVRAALERSSGVERESDSSS